MKLQLLVAAMLSTVSLASFADVTNPPQPAPTVTVSPTQLMTNPGAVQQLTGQAPTTGTPAIGTPTNDVDKLSYAAGVQLGQGLKMRGMTINIDRLIQGIRDGYSGGKLQMNQEEIRDTIVKYQQQMTAQMSAKLKSQSQDNTDTSVQFFEKNKNEAGVTTLPSGLQYKIVKAGTGVQPTASDVIVVNYEGTTLDGKIFDSSYKRGQPMTAQLKYMIPGWVEALQLMKKGSTWMLYIPANLAYGERGAPPVIGPNQALIFKVELLDVKKS